MTHVVYGPFYNSGIKPDYCYELGYQGPPYAPIDNAESLQYGADPPHEASGNFLGLGAFHRIAGVYAYGYTSHGLANPVNGEIRIRAIAIQSDFTYTPTQSYSFTVKCYGESRIATSNGGGDPDPYGLLYDSLWGVSTPMLKTDDHGGYILLTDLNLFLISCESGTISSDFIVKIFNLNLGIKYNTVFFNDDIVANTNRRRNIIIM